MKQMILVLAVLLAMQSCQSGGEGFIVNLDLEGTDNKWVLLTRRIDREYVGIDSVLVKEGQPAFLSGSVEGVTTMYLSVKGEKESLKMLIENESYSLSGTLPEAVIQTKAEAQTELNAYNKKSVSMEAERSGLAEAYYAARDKEDRQAMDSILAMYDMADTKKKHADSLYMAEHPASAVSVLLLRGSFYDYETKRLEEILLHMDESLHQMDEYQYIFKIVQKQKVVAVGNPYKDFGLPTPEGEVLNISDIHLGQVLLIDFWASWCGPCRRANPEVVALYREFHDQGFDVLGVSLDRDREAWLKAISDDQLTWHHISDVKGWECEGSKLYGVPAIPHTVLVDREGIIRGKNLHGDDLREAILSLL